MILNYLGILSGLLLLIFGADRFVFGAANIARNLGIAPLTIGLAIVGLGTSAPEVLVGSVAAIGGKTEIAVGNALGSNIANIGLVLGMSVMIKPVVIASKTLKREYSIMLVAILVAFIVLFDQELSRLDSALLLTSLIAGIYWIIRLARQSPVTDPLVGEFEQELSGEATLARSTLFLLLGLILLLGGAELLVRSAIIVAKHFGLSDLVIGLTIIAIGTSLPELAASIMSILKNEADIAVGNVIGSNMFNILAVIGVPGLINPTAFGNEVLFRDFPVMLGLSLLMGFMVFLTGSGRFDRIEGSLLMLCFIFYQYWLFI